MSLQNKNIILGITGSIAAYKAAEIASSLTKASVLVNVVMTEESQKFITPLTFAALTHRPIITSFWDEDKNAIPTHIDLADNADLVVIAPATAHILAQMAHGLAGDVLPALLLATRSPILVAPAMNGKMWAHPATQDNVAILKKRGIEFIGPEKGTLSCGYEGEGRLCSVDKINARIFEILGIKKN